MPVHVPTVLPECEEGCVLTYSGGAMRLEPPVAPPQGPPDPHTHPTSEVVGLDAALSGKAATSHTHAIADTTGLQTALDGKQPLDAELSAIAAVGAASLEEETAP